MGCSNPHRWSESRTCWSLYPFCLNVTSRMSNSTCRLPVSQRHIQAKQPHWLADWKISQTSSEGCSTTFLPYVESLKLLLPEGIQEVSLKVSCDVILQAVWPMHTALFRSQALPYQGTKLLVFLGCFCNSLFLHSFFLLLLGIFHCLSLLSSPPGLFLKYTHNLSPLLPSLGTQPTSFRAQLRYYFPCCH
jgi:hypothetical protein